jgi:probable rRNA maturation factor
MPVETVIEDPRWQAAGLAALAERAAEATLAHAGLDPAAHLVALLGCDDARIAALNDAFRGRGGPTNVLSWPSEARSPGQAPADEELGDVAIAYDTCAAEAAAQGKPLADHATHLLVHAVLHLLGHDHDTDARADAMEARERAICATLGVPDPYAGDVS